MTREQSSCSLTGLVAVSSNYAGVVLAAARLCLALLVHDRSGVLNKVVNEHRPSSLLVVVTQVVIHCGRKVQQQVPRVFRDGPVVVLLEELRPKAQELKSAINQYQSRTRASSIWEILHLVVSTAKPVHG